MKNYLFVLFPFYLMWSCATPDEEGPVLEELEPDASETQRIETKEVVIQIEGMAETVPVRLLSAPDEFPISFSTYIPDDMRVDTIYSDEGITLQITAAFGGNYNAEAHVSIFAFPAATTKDQAEQTVFSFDAEPVEEKRYAWPEAEYQLQGARSGFLALASHEETWFYILAAYPPEYGDGMGPRIHLILDEWQWSSGEPL